MLENTGSRFALTFAFLLAIAPGQQCPQICPLDPALSSTIDPPEVIHYRFDVPTGSGSTITNHASPGTLPPTGTLMNLTTVAAPQGCASTGALSGSGTPGSFVDSGWNSGLPNCSDWTVGCWIDNRANAAPGTLQYLFGFGTSGTNAFRCFSGSTAGAQDVLLRGVTNQVRIVGGASTTAPVHIAFVYRACEATIYGYLNGIRVAEEMQTGPALVAPPVAGADFWVGGTNGATQSLQSGVLLDEFRFYSRAVDGIDFASWLESCSDRRYQTNKGESVFTINEGVRRPAPETFPTPTGGNPIKMPACTALTFHFGSLSSLGYDIWLSSFPPVPIGGGGFLTAGGQCFNIDLSAPSLRLFGDFGTSFSPFTATFSPGPGTYTVQMVNLTPALPDLFAISGSGTVQMNPPADGAPLPGPVFDDASQVFDVSCWGSFGAGPVPFYGTSFNNFFVSSNGHVTFGGIDDDFSPSLPDVLTDFGRVGFWADLNPSAGGSIQVSNVPMAAGVLRVEYLNVPYFSSMVTNSFDIELDTVSGTISLNGLTGIQFGTNSAKWIGISPGTTLGPGMAATDPGPTFFPPGGFGGVPAPQDMIYDFTPSTAFPNLPSSLGSFLNAIVFLPNGAGNYNWTAF